MKSSVLKMKHNVMIIMVADLNKKKKNRSDNTPYDFG